LAGIIDSANETVKYNLYFAVVKRGVTLYYVTIKMRIFDICRVAIKYDESLITYMLDKLEGKIKDCVV